MPTPNGYDSRKAEAYNKLIQSGVSPDTAFTQAGITEAESGNYALGNNGQLGAMVVGSGKVAGVDYDKVTAADAAESNRFNQGLQSQSNFEEVDYAETSRSKPSSVTPMTYTTTSTETVSGGGTTTITAGPRQATAASQAIQPALNTKQAEIDQFIKDNPSDFARKKQGLPPLTPEEKQQRQEKLNTLTAERGALKNQQIDAETPSTTPVTTTPNTTTTTQTVTTQTVSTNQEVDPETDQKLSQENEVQLDATTSVANDTTTREPAATTSYYENDGTASSDQVATTEPAATTSYYENDGTASSDQVATTEPGAGTTYYESDGTASSDQVATTEPGAGTTYYESDGTASSDRVATTEPGAVDSAQDLANERNDAAAVDAAAAQESNDAANSQAATKIRAKNQATLQSRYKQPGDTDWRVRLMLAESSDYLYNAPDSDILTPLKSTNGVIFPYTPNISINYQANYEQYDLVHSNYRGVFYKNSKVGDISLRGTFTAQDTTEASYMLAVIHFFRSVTKMFYGKDEQRGTPPPLVYLAGFGDFQFKEHPCLVSSFNYTLPNDVDYIRAVNPNNYGLNMLGRRSAPLASTYPGIAGALRLANALIPKGALPGTPAPGVVTQNVANTQRATYVPTKMEIDITLIPVQTRDQVSKQFSLKGFANGNLLKGGFW